MPLILANPCSKDGNIYVENINNNDVRDSSSSAQRKQLAGGGITSPANLWTCFVIWMMEMEDGDGVI